MVTHRPPCKASTELLIGKLKFARAVKSITDAYIEDFKWEGQALLALQEAAEAYIVAVRPTHTYTKDTKHTHTKHTTHTKHAH